MQPTLNPDSSQWRDIVLFSRFSAPWHQYQRDDIVSLRSPEDPKRVLIKRILATEGDTVKTLPPYPDREVVVPKGHAWIEGDEHFLSDDSNRFGAISQSLIQSKFVMILWPMHRFGFLKPGGSQVNVGGQPDRQTLAELKRNEVRRSRVQHAAMPLEA